MELQVGVDLKKKKKKSNNEKNIYMKSMLPKCVFEFEHFVIFLSFLKGLF